MMYVVLNMFSIRLLKWACITEFFLFSFFLFAHVSKQVMSKSEGVMKCWYFSPINRNCQVCFPWLYSAAQHNLN